MKVRISKLIAGFALVNGILTLNPVQAHHSLTGEFDTSVTFEVRGALTKLEWFNPHIWFYVDAINANGEIEKWQCEMGSPNQLMRAGWKKEDLPIGTVIRAQGNPARDGSKTCSTFSITLDDGTQVFSRGGAIRDRNESDSP